MHVSVNLQNLQLGQVGKHVCIQHSELAVRQVAVWVSDAEVGNEIFKERRTRTDMSAPGVLRRRLC